MEIKKNLHLIEAKYKADFLCVFHLVGKIAGDRTMQSPAITKYLQINMKSVMKVKCRKSSIFSLRLRVGSITSDE
jgi:hypothetical protein